MVVAVGAFRGEGIGMRIFFSSLQDDFLYFWDDIACFMQGDIVSDADIFCGDEVLIVKSRS